MSGDAGLPGLHAELGALGSALDVDDLTAAGEVMAAYDRSLRGYLEQRGRAAPIDAIRELLRMQNDLLLRMATRRHDIAGELGRMRKAGEASRAYAAAGAEG